MRSLEGSEVVNVEPHRDPNEWSHVFSTLWSDEIFTDLLWRQPGSSCLPYSGYPYQ